MCVVVDWDWTLGLNCRAGRALSLSLSVSLVQVLKAKAKTCMAVAHETQLIWMLLESERILIIQCISFSWEEIIWVTHENIKIID